MAEQQASAGINIGQLLSGVGDIAGLFTDKKTKTTTGAKTTTSGLDISQEGVAKMISDILSSNQGLAAVSSGQKTAGLYNSTTNQQLVNDLVDRASSSVARDTAKTVTTTTGGESTTVQPAAFGIGDALLGVGGAMLGNKILKSETVQDAIGSAGDFLGGIFGGGSGAEAAGMVSGISDIGNFAGGVPWLSMGADFLSGDTEDALTTGAGFLLGNALLPGVGGPLGGMISEVLPVGDIVSSAGDLVGGLFGGSVVCTELHTQGLMSSRLYQNDIAYARKYMSVETLNGYRYWGIPLVKLMRKSKLVTHIAAWFAISRAHYIASITPNYTGVWNKKLAVRGKRINAIGVPICNLIAKVTTPKDYSKLYNVEA